MTDSNEVFDSADARGLTLIELLIVIVIIGILAGVVFSVINPSFQRQKASEGVLRETITKLCGSMQVCLINNPPDNCDTFAEISPNDPNNTPKGATYTVSLAPPQITITGNLNTTPDCEITCTYNYTSAKFSDPVMGGDCLLN